MRLYAIRSGDSVKIGVSGNPLQRLAAIQTGCPTAATLLWHSDKLSRKQAFILEAAIHGELRKERTVGEWFRLDDQTLFESLRRFFFIPDEPNCTAKEAEDASMSWRPIRGYKATDRYPATEFQLRHIFRNRFHNGMGPAFSKVGARVLFDPEKLDALLASQSDRPFGDNS